MSPDALARIRALPCWTGAPQTVPLAGGMTNHNFLVTDGRGRFVVRLGVDLPEHGVLRQHEPAVARAAHAIGISPEVVHTAPGLLVSRFVEGRVLEPADLRDRRHLPGVVDLLRRCHRDMARHLQSPLPRFDVFGILRDYAAVLQVQPVHLLQGRLAGLVTLAARLEPLAKALPAAFCHNDLLAANFINDGARLWLIDWDYAGMGAPLFDLANLSTNNGFGSLQEAQMLDLYLGGPPTEELAGSLRAMQTASLLREVLWGAVSACHRRVDFDFATYTRTCLERLDSWCRDHG